MKQKFFIDTHKGATALFVLLLMAVFNQWQNPTAWVYLALHGTYGILWVMKSRIFPDSQWEQPCSLGYGLVIWGSLSLYWVTPILIMIYAVHAPGWYLALCASMFTFGVFFHFTTDMQKFTALKLKPDALISDGMFAYSRNLNYFGELLIYGGFGLLAIHWLPLLILLMWIVFLWLPNMRKKDRVLSRYPGFEKYKEKTRRFIPFIY
jgi:steroid 5-alpha reductase family enzyme